MYNQIILMEKTVEKTQYSLWTGREEHKNGLQYCRDILTHLLV